MPPKINIEAAFTKFNDTFSPKIVGEVNGLHIKLVRVEGDKVPWHTHDHEDELFYVLDGQLDVLERNNTITLQTGEFYIVTHGVEHKVVPHGHVKLMLVEPAAIKHTGNVQSDITLEKHDWLE